MKTCGVQVSNTSLQDAAPWGGGTIGQALLEPTVIYVEPLLELMEQTRLKVSQILFAQFIVRGLG